jgi:hypothetical protein
MTQEKITPLRERMMEDMRIHGMGGQSSTLQGFSDARQIPPRRMICAPTNFI